MSDLSPPSPETLNRFRAAIGAAHVLTGADDTAPYLTEWRDKFVGRAAAVLRPGTPHEVAEILGIANSACVGIVPQGGNTGLVGGQIPFERGNEIVVSLSRLKAVRGVDTGGGVIFAEAGLTVAEVQAVAEAQGRLFPLSLASEGSCQVGGVLSTNAGGINVLAYGSARALTLGIEVALPDGRLWNGLRSLVKDNTGYDLRDLFIGAEGTLGIITAAALKTVPRPAETATAVLAFASLASVHDLFRRLDSVASGRLTAFEFMSAGIVDFAVKHMPGVRRPLDVSAPWYVLAELSSGAADGTTRTAFETVLSAAITRGDVLDASLAASQAQAEDFWRLREGMSEAQKFEGGSIKHDVSVPLSRMAEFIERANAVVAKIVPGARPVPFGHFGDGNVHYNVSQPPGADRAQYLALWDTMNGAIHALVTDMGGSISAEHGIGRLKRAELAATKSAVELDLMRAIKQALDPHGIMNPGKVL